MQQTENLLPFKELQKVYCINVKENTQRRSFMEQQFKMLNIDPNMITFIDAITPLSDEYARYMRLGALKYKNKVAQAISLSHRKIWEDIKNNEYNAAMVLEDDIEFNMDYLKQNNTTTVNLENFKNKKYFIHLLTSYPSKILNLEPKPKVKHNLSVVNIKYGVGAYIINDKSASVLLKDSLFFPVIQPVDDYMWTIKRKLSFRNQYLFLPFICQNASQPKTKAFESNISFSSNFKL